MAGKSQVDDEESSSSIMASGGQVYGASPPSPGALTADLDAVTDADIRRLSRNRLVKMLMTCADDRIIVPLIKELLDRIAPAETGGDKAITKIEVIIIDPKQGV